MEIIVLIISGIIGGLIAGMLGLGGGVFYILVLPFIMNLFGIPSSESSAFVVANSLMGITFASLISIITEFQKLKKYIQEVLFIGFPAIILSMLATKFIVHSSWFSKEAFNIFVIAIMLFILIKMQLKNNVQTKGITGDRKLKPSEGALTGSISGFISALSGLGGGVIIIPILQIAYKQGMRKAKIISLAIIFMTALFISLQNLISIPKYSLENIYHIGYIIPSISVPIIIGVLIGGPIGVKWSSNMNDRILNKLFSVVVLLVLIEKVIGLLT